MNTNDIKDTINYFINKKDDIEISVCEFIFTHGTKYKDYNEIEFDPFKFNVEFYIEWVNKKLRFKGESDPAKFNYKRIFSIDQFLKLSKKDFIEIIETAFTVEHLTSMLEEI